MTLGYSVQMSLGRVAAGETDEVWTPRTPWAGCIVVFCHGSGNPQGGVDATQQPATVALLASLAAAGVPVIAGDFAGQAWGNDTVLARIDAAWALGKTLFPTARTDKLLLIGGSMGGAATSRYSQKYPGKVAAHLGLIPLLDLLAFYAANPANQAEIAAAWGVATGAALPAAADNASGAAKQAGVPTLLGYSTVDTVVRPAWVTAYAAKIGARTIVTDTTAGHSDAAIAGMPIPTAAQFLAATGGP